MILLSILMFPVFLIGRSLVWVAVSVAFGAELASEVDAELLKVIRGS